MGLHAHSSSGWWTIDPLLATVQRHRHRLTWILMLPFYHHLSLQNSHFTRSFHMDFFCPSSEPYIYPSQQLGDLHKSSSSSSFLFTCAVRVAGTAGGGAATARCCLLQKQLCRLGLWQHKARLQVWCRVGSQQLMYTACGGRWGQFRVTRPRKEHQVVSRSLHM
jgi:hypothetical protein